MKIAEKHVSVYKHYVGAMSGSVLMPPYFVGIGTGINLGWIKGFGGSASYNKIGKLVDYGPHSDVFYFMEAACVLAAMLDEEVDE